MQSTIFWWNRGSCMEMISKSFWGFVLMLAPALWAESPAECEVWRLETAFAQSVEQHDAKAFASYFTLVRCSMPLPIRLLVGRKKCERTGPASLKGRV